MLSNQIRIRNKEKTDNKNVKTDDKNTGWAKSQYPYVGLNSSVTECPIEIILSGMTYYHHWFKKFVKSKYVCVHFFQMRVHFRFEIELCLAI